MTPESTKESPSEFHGEAAGGVPPAPLGRVGLVVSWSAGLMVAAMMFVTAADVLGRYFLNSPVHGGFQATEILMGLVIFAGLPLATAAREHISADFLASALPLRGRCVQAAVVDVACAAMCVGLAWRVFERGSALVAANEIFAEFGLKRGYVAWAMAALILGTALAFTYAGVVAARAALKR